MQAQGSCCYTVERWSVAAAIASLRAAARQEQIVCWLLKLLEASF
jgi:hypothetical protein